MFIPSTSVEMNEKKGLEICVLNFLKYGNLHTVQDSLQLSLVVLELAI